MCGALSCAQLILDALGLCEFTYFKSSRSQCSRSSSAMHTLRCHGWSTYARRLSAPGIQIFVAEHDVPARNSLSTDISSALKGSDLVIALWAQASS
jgi:hypothetical protein